MDSGMPENWPFHGGNSTPDAEGMLYGVWESVLELLFRLADDYRKDEGKHNLIQKDHVQKAKERLAQVIEAGIGQMSDPNNPPA